MTRADLADAGSPEEGRRFKAFRWRSSRRHPRIVWISASPPAWA